MNEKTAMLECITGSHCDFILTAWRRQQMETFSTLYALCTGNSPVKGEFHSQRPVTRSFDISLICAWINGRVNKSWGWWFETRSRSLWRHCYGILTNCFRSTTKTFISRPPNWYGYGTDNDSLTLKVSRGFVGHFKCGHLGNYNISNHWQMPYCQWRNPNKP